MRGIVTELSTSKLMPHFDSENRRKLLSGRGAGKRGRVVDTRDVRIATMTRLVGSSYAVE